MLMSVELALLDAFILEVCAELADGRGSLFVGLKQRKPSRSSDGDISGEVDIDVCCEGEVTSSTSGILEARSVSKSPLQSTPRVYILMSRDRST